MEYRREKGSDTWHWCKNCSHYPKDNYEVRYEKPTSGELCDECMAKDKKGGCIK